MMMKNCHVLPMSLLTRGPWEKYRKINGITLTNKNSTDSTPNSMELKCDCGEYEMIYGDSVRQQVNVYNRFRSNHESLDELKRPMSLFLPQEIF